MNTGNELSDANSKEPILVYRRVLNFLVVFFGFVFFLASVLLDLVGVTAIGWFETVPWLGYAFLLFLVLGISWFGTILVELRRPVIEITQKEVKLASVSRPGRRIALDLTQVAAVAALWQPDTVPAYVIFDLKCPAEIDCASGVWMRREGSRVYYECSNLTMNAVEIARILHKKLSG